MKREDEEDGVVEEEEDVEHEDGEIVEDVEDEAIDGIDDDDMDDDGGGGDSGGEDDAPRKKVKKTVAKPKAKKGINPKGTLKKKNANTNSFAAYEKRIREYPAANFSCLDQSYLSDFGLTAALKKNTKHHAQILAQVAREHGIVIKGFTSENKKHGMYEALPCGGRRESEGGDVRVVYIGKQRNHMVGAATLFCIKFLNKNVFSGRFL